MKKRNKDIAVLVIALINLAAVICTQVPGFVAFALIVYLSTLVVLTVFATTEPKDYDFE